MRCSEEDAARVHRVLNSPQAQWNLVAADIRNHLREAIMVCANRHPYPDPSQIDRQIDAALQRIPELVRLELAIIEKGKSKL